MDKLKPDERGDLKPDEKGDLKPDEKGDLKPDEKGGGFNGLGGAGGGFFGGGGLVVVSFIGPAGFDVRQLAAGILVGNGGQPRPRSKSSALGDAAVKAQAAARKYALERNKLAKFVEGKTIPRARRKPGGGKPQAGT